MIKKYLFLLVIAQTIFSGACKKKNYDGATGPQGPTGTAGASYHGVITGHIVLYDSYGVEINKQLDSVHVQLSNGMSTLTDPNGSYSFSDVPTGNYNISASKNGFGSTMAINTTFVRDTVYKNIKMSEKPDYNVSHLNANAIPPSALDNQNALAVTIPAATKPRNCIIFVGKTRSVNPGNYLLAYIVPVRGWSARQYVQDYELRNVNILYGETVYYAVYSYAMNDASVYQDVHSGLNVYTAVGDTAMIDSAIAP